MKVNHKTNLKVLLSLKRLTFKKINRCNKANGTIILKSNDTIKTLKDEIKNKIFVRACNDSKKE